MSLEGKIAQGGFGPECRSEELNVLDYAMYEALPFIMNAIDRIGTNCDAPLNRTFCVADYGTADGVTAMPIITKIIEKIREIYGDEQEIQIHYEDQPINDFKTLFKRIYDCTSSTNSYLKATGKNSYLKAHKDVFVCICGTQFYSQCFPSESIHFGFSETAMHWLQNKPCNLISSLHHMLSDDKKEKEFFSKEAKESWELILKQRAKELIPGGQMVLWMLGIDSEGQFTGHTKRAVHKRYNVMTKILQEMVNECIISEMEFANINFVEYHRTEEDITTPLKDRYSVPHKLGLRLVNFKICIIPCPFYTEWIQSGLNKDDKTACKAYAKGMVGIVRLWTLPTLISGLNSNRTPDGKRQVAEEFYKRYVDKIVINPADYCMDYVYNYIHFRKQN